MLATWGLNARARAGWLTEFKHWHIFPFHLSVSYYFVCVCVYAHFFFFFLLWFSFEFSIDRVVIVGFFSSSFPAIFFIFVLYWMRCLGQTEERVSCGKRGMFVCVCVTVVVDLKKIKNKKVEEVSSSVSPFWMTRVRHSVAAATSSFVLRRSDPGQANGQ